MADNWKFKFCYFKCKKRQVVFSKKYSIIQDYLNISELFNMLKYL